MRVLLGISVWLVFGPLVLFSSVFTETIPTGSSLTTAILVPADTTLIQGTLSENNHVDLYRIFFAQDGFYTITANSTAFDTNLHFFNSDGNPLGANDDIDPLGGNFNSSLSFDLLPGFYFIGVALNNSFGLDALGNVISDNDFGVTDPFGVLAGWDVEISESTGLYDILISQPLSGREPEGSPLEPIPEPGTLVLTATSLLLALRWGSSRKG